MNEMSNNNVIDEVVLGADGRRWLPVATVGIGRQQRLLAAMVDIGDEEDIDVDDDR